MYPSPSLTWTLTYHVRQNVRLVEGWVVSFPERYIDQNYETQAFDLVLTSTVLFYRDVCMKCALQVEDCPMCRRRIQDRVLEDHSVSPSHQTTSWQWFIARRQWTTSTGTSHWHKYLTIQDKSFKTRCIFNLILAEFFWVKICCTTRIMLIWSRFSLGFLESFSVPSIFYTCVLIRQLILTLIFLKHSCFAWSSEFCEF